MLQVARNIRSSTWRWWHGIEHVAHGMQHVAHGTQHVAHGTQHVAHGMTPPSLPTFLSMLRPVHRLAQLHHGLFCGPAHFAEMPQRPGDALEA
eukprot:351369-Chlamydomonas_euryale.AAC.7